MATTPGIRPAILSRQSHMYSVQRTSTAAVLLLSSESKKCPHLLAAAQMQEDVFTDGVSVKCAEFSVFNLTGVNQQDKNKISPGRKVKSISSGGEFGCQRPLMAAWEGCFINGLLFRISGVDSLTCAR